MSSTEKATYDQKPCVVSYFCQLFLKWFVMTSTNKVSRFAPEKSLCNHCVNMTYCWLLIHSKQHSSGDLSWFSLKHDLVLFDGGGNKAG